METIKDVNQLIFRTKDRNELLRKACEAIVGYTYKMVWIGFCDEKNKQITPQAQAGFEEGYLESVKITYDDSEYGMGPSGMAVKTAGSNVMRFIATDPRYEPWRAEAIKRGYRSSVAIPIFGADKVIGVLNVYADKEDAFNQEEVKLLEELAHDISTGLRGICEHAKRRQAEQKLLEHQKQLKRLASQLALAEERERRRIAGELHDQVGQSLALAKIKLDALRSSATSQPAEEVLADVSKTLQQLMDETRLLTFDLSSPILYELGFEAAVSEWLNEQVRDKHGIATEFADDGQPKPLGDDVRMLLFRNVRELLINCIKHANADKVRVGIRRIDGSIEVTVEDNGVGFDPTEARTMVAKKAGFGLFSIRESLEELGGRFEIESKRGAGCRVIMTAPLKGKTRKTATGG
jgi:signal transduction histidine kinase